MDTEAKRVFHVVEEYYSKFSNYENDWQDLLHENLKYTSSLRNRINKKEFIEINETLQFSVLDFKIFCKFSSGRTACFEVSYRICSNTPEEIIVILKCVEFFEIEGGKIKAINSYFDSREMIERLSEYKMSLK